MKYNVQGLIASFYILLTHMPEQGEYTYYNLTSK